MSLVGERILLRIYLQSADRAPHTPTYQRILQAARQRGLSGATVLRGIHGFGSRGVIGESSWALTQHVPVILEMVDDAATIRRFLEEEVAPLMIGGLATLERAHVGLYRHGAEGETGRLTLPPAINPLSTLPQLQERPTMQINDDGVLVRVFIGESDRFEGKPLFEKIVGRARELGLAGATVLRGIEGFGAHSVVHKAHLLEMSADLPIVVEIVDSRPKVELLLPELEKMVTEGMVTLEYVRILAYHA